MRVKLCLLFVLIITFSWSQTTKTFTANGTFSVPNGVTSIAVQAWGGGGSGGGASGAPLLFGRGAAGGGGGAYASASLLVNPGTTLNVVVAGQTSGGNGTGTAGGNSTISGFESVILAAGGSGGDANNEGGTPIGGSGGTIAASAGTTRLAGANGGNGNSWNLLGLLLSSGAGGSGGGSGGAGGGAVSGLIFSNAPGNTGSAPGGAGSGGINSALGTSQAGGAGGAGQVIITYTCPGYSLTSTSATGVCVSDGSTATVTLTSGASNLPVGTYTVTYNRSSPSASALTANLTVTTAGTGIFTATGLTTVGSSTITVTKIESGSCSSTINANNTATVIVSPASVGGTVTGGTTINSGNTSGLLTLSGHTGSVIKWQSSVSPFTTWVDIANTTTTYTSGPLNETTQFRAVVQNGTCAAVNSVPTTVTVNPRPTIAVAASAESVCSGSIAQSTSLSYSGTTGSPVSYSIVWNSSPANSFIAVTDAALPASPIIIAIPASTAPGTYTGTLTVKNAGGAVSTGSTFTVTVNESPFIGSSSVINQICVSNSSQYASLPYGGGSGNPTGYYIEWNAGSPIPNQGPTPHTFSTEGSIDTIEIPANIPAGRYFGQMYIYNEFCTYSLIVILDVNSETVAGTVTGGTTITPGNTSGLLTLSGHTGSVIKWQSSVSPFTNWVDIANTNTTYTSGILTETTQFRAVVRNILCAILNSEPTTVTVEELPTITLQSSIAICGSGGFIDLPYSATTGNPITYSIVWNSSPANTFTSVTDEPLQPDAIAIFVPAGTDPGTYTGTLTVKNADGALSLGSNFTVTTYAFPTIEVEELFSTICATNNPQFSSVLYNESTGNPTAYSIDWDDTANAALLVDVPSTPYTFDQDGGIINVPVAANVPPGTYTATFIVENEFCISEYILSLKVNPGAVGGTVTGGTTITSGSTSGLLTLSGYTGTINYWESSVSPFTEWTYIDNQAATYTSEPLTETTQFRAAVRRGLCAFVNSEPTTVTVNAVLPTIDLAAATENGCYGSNNSNLKLAYSGSTGQPVTYSIIWDSSPANTFTPVTDAPLPASPILISIPSGTATNEGTYTGTLTVKDTNGVVSTGSSFNLTVGALAFIGTDGEVDPITTSNDIQYAALQYVGTSGNGPASYPTQYFIDWNEAANNALLTDQPLIEFDFIVGLDFIYTIVVPPNVPPGTYTGTMYISNENSCNQAQEITLTVAPQPTPTITLESSAISTCSYSDGTLVLLDSAERTGNPTTYSIVWDSSPANDLNNVEDRELPDGPIQINFPADIAPATYTAVLTVKNANGDVSPNVPFSVTINTPTITTIGKLTSICSSTSSQNATLAYDAVAGNPVQYYIDWNSDANNASLPDQGLSFFDFASGGGVINTIEIPANVPAGLYFGTLVISNGTNCDKSQEISLLINQSETALIATNIKPQTDEFPGSFILEGLPQGDWSILVNPGNTTVTGSGQTIAITDLQAGTYTYSLLSNSDCPADPLEVEIIYEIIVEPQFVDTSESSKNQILVASQNKVINVETKKHTIDKVFVFDVSGTLIYKKENVSDPKLVIDNLRSGNQVLVVKVVLDNNETETKKVIY